MSRFDKAFVNITPDMGHAIMLQALGGAFLQTISYQKVEDTTDSITRLLVTGKMETMVHPFACDFFHLTDLEPVEYSFLLQGKNADGTALSLSFKETPKKSVETPELVSLVGMESELKAEIKLKTENEGGNVVFFLVNAEGTITEYRHQVDYVSLEEVHEIIISNDILPQGQTFEVSLLMEAERGPTAMTTPLLITMANKPDRIDVEKSYSGRELVVDKPNDYGAEFKLDIEASKFSVVDIDDSDAVDSLLEAYSSANHQRAYYVGAYNIAAGTQRFINHSWNAELIGALALYWNNESWVKGGKVTSIGQRQGNGDTPVYFDVDTVDFTDTIVFVQPVIKLNAVSSQVDPAFTGNNGTEHYIRARALANMGEYVSVRARWTNEDGSSAWSSDIVIRSFIHRPPGEPSLIEDLKAIPSIADKILSFKVAGRSADTGLKLIGAVGGGLDSAVVQYANKVDGRIVESFPADQDLSGLSASQYISADLAYENGEIAHFQGRLTIPRIEAGQVSIDATEVLTQEGGKVEFDFADSSSYIDGASRTSVTINDKAITEEAFIPANSSGSTDFQLKSVQFTLPAASIAATPSMDALSGVADWQSLPIKQVEVFGNDLTLDGPTAVGDFFINFDFSVTISADANSGEPLWRERTAAEKLELLYGNAAAVEADPMVKRVYGLNEAFSQRDWYPSGGWTTDDLTNLALKYEDGELYFVELVGSSWNMYYESGDIKRINMTGTVGDEKLELPLLDGKKVWYTTTLYDNQQAPLALAEGTEFAARKFILDRTVHTHTAVSPPAAATITISANGLTGEVRATIERSGSTGNQTLVGTAVNYYNDDGISFVGDPLLQYAAEAGPGVKVTALVSDSYNYTKADGSTHSHDVTSLASNEAHGMTEPIINDVTKSPDNKQLQITYESGGKHNDLSLFVFAIDNSVSPDDRYLGTTSGKGSFHQVKQISNLPLTGSRNEIISFSHFSGPIHKYMVVLTRIPANGDGDSTSATESDMN